MRTNLVAAAIFTVALSGCASIVGKSEYAVAVNSKPDQASFIIKNRAGQQVHSGVTPQTVTLKSSSGYFKGEAYTIVLNKPGMPEKTFTMKSTVSGWYFGNIIFGGLVGMLVIDPATGAMYKLPPTVDIDMDQPVASSAQDKLTIVTVDSLTDEQKSRLVAVN